MLHPVGPDVLCDPAGFPVHDFRLADIVQKRGLPVINVSHEGDDGRPQFELFGRLIFLRLGLLDDFLHLVDSTTLLALLAFKDKTVLLADIFRHFRFDGLIRRHEHLQLDEILHDLKRFQPHHLRKHAHDDGRLNADGVSFNHSDFLRRLALFQRFPAHDKVRILDLIRQLRNARELFLAGLLGFSDRRRLLLFILIDDVERLVLLILNGLLLGCLSPLPFTTRRLVLFVDQVENFLLFVAVALVRHGDPLNLSNLP